MRDAGLIQPYCEGGSKGTDKLSLIAFMGKLIAFPFKSGLID